MTVLCTPDYLLQLTYPLTHSLTSAVYTMSSKPLFARLFLSLLRHPRTTCSLTPLAALVSLVLLATMALGSHSHSFPTDKYMYDLRQNQGGHPPPWDD